MNSHSLFRPEHLEGLRLSAASTQETSIEEVPKLIKASLYVWTIRVGGDIVALVGIAAPSFLSESVFLWCVTTDKFEQRPLVSVRYLCRIIDNLRQMYHNINGVVAPHCKRWVELMQFTLGPEEIFEGRPFHTFKWSR